MEKINEIKHNVLVQMNAYILYIYVCVSVYIAAASIVSNVCDEVRLNAS